METEPIRINKEVMNRLRMHIVQRSEGRVYGEIGSTVEKAIKEYLYKEENCHKIILTKETDFFNQYVETKSDPFGRVVMLHPVTRGNPPEEMILIRAGENKLELTLRVGDKEIENETRIKFFLEDQSLGHRQPVGSCLYEELKNGFTIRNEVRVHVQKGLSIYVPSYAGKEICAENIMFYVDLCPKATKARLPLD